MSLSCAITNERLQEMRKDGELWANNCPRHVLALVAEVQRIREAAALIEGTLAMELEAHRRTIAERDAALQRAEFAERAATILQGRFDMAHDRSVVALQRAEQAERANATMHGEVDARLEWQQRAEQAEAERDREYALRGRADAAVAAAEAALAQAQEARERMIEKLTCRNGGPHYCPNCDNRIELPVNAPPPALPPLPEGWESYPFHDLTAGDTVRFRKTGTTFGVTAYDDGVEVDDFTGVFDPVGEWIAVLRHAEAAHLKLKEGGGQ